MLRRETIKLLEENIGRTRDDINQSKVLYDPLPGIMEKVTDFSFLGSKITADHDHSCEFKRCLLLERKVMT